VGGRTFRLFEVRRTLVAEAAGEVVLAAPVVRYSYATRFREDALGGRVPEDRHDAVVRGEPLDLLVKPLPEEGRPEGFGGAVGRFTVEAALAEGGPGVLRVEVRIRGEGNLARFDPPRLDGLEGFHGLGVLDDRGVPVRTVTYDLAPEKGVAALPPIRLPQFDPVEERWRVAETAPIPVLAGAVAPAVGGAAEEPAAVCDTGGVPVGLLSAALLAALAVAGLILWVRRGGRPGAAPSVSDAASEAGRRLDAPGADPAEVLVGFLAARLGVLPAAVVSPDLRRRLVEAGARGDLADRTADLVDRLVAARYGGAQVPDGPAAARALVEEWGRFPLRGGEE
jgi:hypothetical protein